MANEELAKPPAKEAKAPAKKVAAKPAVKAQPKLAAKKVVKAKADKPERSKKPKVVRDSFTMPKPEYAAIATLKQRAAKHKQAVKKGELIRAGIKALSSMSDDAFLKAVRAIPSIKTGRPKAQ